MTAPGIEATRAPSGYWSLSVKDVLRALASDLSGLSADEAERRRRGSADSVDEHRRRPALRVLVSQFMSPIVLVLVSATVIAMVLGDLVDGVIIIVIIAASGVLGFWQEYRADAAVAALLARVQVTSRVRRGGVESVVPLRDVVPGDVVLLSAGDLVPADARLIESTALQVDASALTGESFRRRRTPTRCSTRRPRSPHGRRSSTSAVMWSAAPAARSSSRSEGHRSSVGWHVRWDPTRCAPRSRRGSGGSAGCSCAWSRY